LAGKNIIKLRNKTLKNFFGDFAFIYLFQHTNNTYILSQLYTRELLRLPKKLPGFEPGSSVPEADAMSTVSRRHSSETKPKIIDRQ
jgi:hypothetical protein